MLTKNDTNPEQELSQSLLCKCLDTLSQKDYNSAIGVADNVMESQILEKV